MDRDDLRPYLERYYIWYRDSVQRERSDIFFNVFLHRFMLSDDPVFHNHPWNWYFSLVLSGGYWEHTPWGTKWRGKFSFRFIRTNRLKDYLGKKIPADLHWIEVPERGKTWTLFLRGRKTHDWGFVPKPGTGEWIQWAEYLEQQRIGVK